MHTYFTQNIMPKCIYEASPYFALAQSHFNNIALPFDSSIFQKPTTQRRSGPLQYIYLTDKSTVRTISLRSTLQRDLPRIFLVTEIQRKTYSLDKEALFLINNNILLDVVGDLKNKYIPEMNSNYLEQIEFALTFESLHEDCLFYLQDFSLTKYFIYFEGDFENAKYVMEILSEEFIEYDVKILFCSKKEEESLIDKKKYKKLNFVNINNLLEVENHIKEIIEYGSSEDENFNGIHFFVIDSTIEPNTFEILTEEEEYFELLHYYVYMLSGILAEGQNAIIKIRSSFTQMTTEYLFLIKSMFTKVVLHKSIISNPFSFHKYVICEKFSVENGKIIHEYLKQYYKRNLNELIVKLESIFIDQHFRYNINGFNSEIPLLKNYNKIYKEYERNINLAIFPIKEEVMKKVNELRSEKKNEYLINLNKYIPNSNICSEKKTEIIEKNQGISPLDLISMIEELPQKSGRNEEKKKKKKKQHDYD